MKKEEFITERTRIISEMLDNPDENDIYPTSRCFVELDLLYDKIKLQGEVTDEMIEEEAGNLGGREDANKQKYVDAEYFDGFVDGAKAVRDNKIK